MKTIAFHLQKGGVGKTTLSGTVAFELSHKGKTLLVDCDPQGNASDWFVEKMDYELADVLSGKIHVQKALVNAAPGLDILPTLGLDGGLRLYGETKLNDEPFIFCDLFEEVKEMGFDYVVADLSPGMGRLEKSVLMACDEAITPMTPEHFSLKGISAFSNELAKLKKAMRRAPKHLAVVINAFDGRIKQHCELLAGASNAINFSFVKVPVDPVFRKSQREQKAPQILGGMKKETEAAINEIGELLCR